jgi:hypothetical protein
MRYGTGAELEYARNSAAGVFAIVFLGELRQVHRCGLQSGGGTIPFPSVPWHVAQYCVNISLPDAGLVSLIAVFTTTGLVSVFS